jgi:phage baseplate assembly protein W
MPLSRDIGLSQEWIGMPINVAQAKIISELAEVISIQEPRAQIDEVECSAGADETTDVKISAKVVIVDGE